MHDGAIVFSTKLDNKDLEKDLAKLNREIEKTERTVTEQEAKRSPLVQQAEELSQKMKEARAEVVKYRQAWSSGVMGADKDQAAAQERLGAVQAEYQKVVEKIEKIDEKLLPAQDKLDAMKRDAGELQQRLVMAGPSTEKMAKSMEKARKSANKFALRLREVIRSALIFTLITQSLSKFREWMGKVIQTNAEATAAVARLKGALLTMAQPIVEVILPAFIALVNVLTRVVSVMAQLFAMLSGKSVAASKEAAKALNKETEALEETGKAADKAAGSLAGFDEINTIQTESTSGGTDSIAPDFSFDANLTEGQLSNILDLVKLIGSVMLGWKIGSALGLGLGKTIGLMVAILGVIEFVSSLFDAWTNGVSWDNLQGMIFGVTLAVAGLYAVLGPTAAGIGMIIGGLAMLVTGFKDAFENGWNLKNLLLAVAGIFAAGMGIAVLTGSFIPALIAGIAALLLAITVATGHGDELLAGLKETFEGFVDFFKGVFTGDMEKASGGIEKIFDGLGTAIGAVVDGVRDLFDGFFVWLDEKTGGKLTGIINFMRGLFSGLFDFVDVTLGSIMDAGKLMLQGLLDFISGVFTGDWNRAWQGVKKIFAGVWNGIIGILEGAVNLIIRGVNWLISQLNKINFTVPDWVPGVGGKSIGINIPKVRELSIPRLATGAVIPPNREFLAVLGDQKSGTNIEAPEELIRKIVREESGGMNTELLEAILAAIKAGHVMKVDKRVLAETAVDGINNMTRSAGKPVLKL